MKSPWKFLSQLIPQRRSSARSESSYGDDREIEGSRDEAQQSSGSTAEATEIPGGSEPDKGRTIELLTPSAIILGETGINATPGVAEHDDVEASHAIRRRQPNRSATRSRLPGAESEPSAKTSQKPSPERQERAKRIRTDTVVENAAVAHKRKSDQPPSSQDAFLAEVSSLDDDIKQLRIQLAQKLHLQNDQLKKMLARFDDT